MTFASALKHFITQQFEKHGISYDENADIVSLATDYLQLLNRVVVPVPRQVQFSKEIHDSLGDYIEKYPAARSAGASGDSPHLYRIQHPPGRLVEGHIGIPCSVRERPGRSRNVSQGLG